MLYCSQHLIPFVFCVFSLQLSLASKRDRGQELQQTMQRTFEDFKSNDLGKMLLLASGVSVELVFLQARKSIGKLVSRSHNNEDGNNNDDALDGERR